MLGNKRHFNERGRSLLNHGIVPSNEGWGEWLGRYQAAMTKAVNDLKILQVGREPVRER